MSATAVVGGQYGDEGKGKFVHYLVNKENIKIVGRGNGGCNAGHNVHDPEKGINVALHLMPSGILNPHAVNIVGCGTVINPHNFVEEIKIVEEAGAQVTPDNLKLSTRTHVTLQSHRSLDGATDKVGSTAQGIGPTYSDKMKRVGLRLEVFLRDTWRQDVANILESHNKELVYFGREDLIVEPNAEIKRLEEPIARLQPHIVDTVNYISDQATAGNTILLEGAQATMLDINHGTYPYVTSSSTTSGGLALGLGLPPTYVSRVIGVFKLPMTRVGKGPFTTRLSDDEDDILIKLAGEKGTKGSEFGATTGRARDIGWMDVVMAKYTHRVNGFTDLGLTKLDMLTDIKKLKVCTAYDLDGDRIKDLPADTAAIERCTPVYTELDGWDQDIYGETDFDKLPENAQKYVRFIEDYVGVNATMIGTGPDNDHMILR